MHFVTAFRDVKYGFLSLIIWIGELMRAVLQKAMATAHWDLAGSPFYEDETICYSSGV